MRGGMTQTIAMLLGALVLLLVCMMPVTGLSTVDCCSAHYSSFAGSCSASGTVYDNVTYYCVDTSLFGCDGCEVASGTSYKMCSTCCVTDRETCDGGSISLTASWLLIVFIFSSAFLFCLIIFLSAESGRHKDGMTFREAYLLPIPLVALDDVVKVNSYDSEDEEDEEMGPQSGEDSVSFASRTIERPPEVPLATAQVHTYSSNIPVAEPTTAMARTAGRY